MNESKSHKNYSIDSIHRAMELLRAFSMENRELTLTELHLLTGIGKSSLQRLLYTLTKEGLLHKDEESKKYQLGLEFIFLAELVKKGSALVTKARPVMEKLNQETTESISLSIIDKYERKCIYHIESHHELTTLTFVGQTSPLYAGASAKALLAHLPNEEVEMYLKEVSLKPFTNETIDKKENLINELTKIRELGYAMSNGERVKGAASISTPVFDPNNQVIASLTVIIPSARLEEYDIEKLKSTLIDGAKKITNNLRTV